MIENRRQENEVLSLITGHLLLFGKKNWAGRNFILKRECNLMVKGINLMTYI